ncbi:MAG TPA: DUF4199 domain-containing protein, partial [Acidisarcina sp.]
ASMLFHDGMGFGRKAEVFGYTTIVLSLLLVFFGIRSYRDNIGHGRITFARAFAVGISITLISCLCYVVTWEVIYLNFMHDFVDKYSAYVITQARASGASAAVIQAKVEQMKKFKEMYQNPLFNVMMTFIEPFPVGLGITLISALVLKKKEQVEPVRTPLAASS